MSFINLLKKNITGLDSNLDKNNNTIEDNKDISH